MSGTGYVVSGVIIAVALLIIAICFARIRRREVRHAQAAGDAFAGDLEAWKSADTYPSVVTRVYWTRRMLDEDVVRMETVGYRSTFRGLVGKPGRPAARGMVALPTPALWVLTWTRAAALAGSVEPPGVTEWIRMDAPYGGGAS